ncbi:hypothetical protein IE969_12275 [Klebsiella pneumoniae]|nr:hypothetical protein [Klebsiella pneumoniae]
MDPVFAFVGEPQTQRRDLKHNGLVAVAGQRAVIVQQIVGKRSDGAA